MKILNFLNFRFLISLILILRSKFLSYYYDKYKILIYNNDILPALWDIK